MNAVRELVEGMGISIYNEQTGQGLLRYLLVKNRFQIGPEAMVVLLTNGRTFPEGGRTGPHPGQPFSGD